MPNPDDIGSDSSPPTPSTTGKAISYLTSSVLATCTLGFLLVIIGNLVFLNWYSEIYSSKSASINDKSLWPGRYTGIFDDGRYTYERTIIIYDDLRQGSDFVSAGPPTFKRFLFPITGELKKGKWVCRNHPGPDDNWEPDNMVFTLSTDGNKLFIDLVDDKGRTGHGVLYRVGKRKKEKPTPKAKSVPP